MLRVQTLALLGATLLLVAAPAANADEPTLEELSQKLDDLYRFDSSHGTLKMFVKTPHFERELELEVWTEGTEYALVRINSPRKEAGISSLKRGNEMWNYLPKIGKTIRVPPSMMSGSWMGSDFTNDDLMREASWEKDYEVKKSEKSPEGELCLDFTAKPDAAVPWPRVVGCLSRDKLLPKRMEFYDEKDRKARVMEYSDVKTFDGQEMPARMVLTPLTKEGHETVMVYEDLEFDVKHSKQLFSLTNLRRTN